MSLSNEWWNVTFSYWLNTTPFQNRIGLSCKGSRDDAVVKATRLLLWSTSRTPSDIKVISVTNGEDAV